MESTIARDNVKHLFLMSSFRGSGVAEVVLQRAAVILNKRLAKLKLSYITTAGNLHPKAERSWIDDGRQILLDYGIDLYEYDIADKTSAAVQQELVGKDIIFVQGGNTFYLLEQMQKCGFAEILRQCLSQDTIYFGESAGAIVAGRNIAASRYLSTDKSIQLEDYHGLGLVDFILKPHWNRDRKREQYLNTLRDNLEEIFSIKQPIICLNDNQLVYVEGEKFQILEG